MPTPRTGQMQPSQQISQASSIVNPTQPTPSRNRRWNSQTNIEAPDSPTQSLPSLTPAFETSQRSQWFKPQRVTKRAEPSTPQETDSNDYPLELPYTLEMPQEQTATQRESRNSNANHTQLPQRGIISEIKEIILPLLPQIITLLLAKDLSQKIEAILKIGDILNIGDSIGETLIALGISSNAEA